MTGSLTREGPKISFRRRRATARSLLPGSSPRHRGDDRDLVILFDLLFEAGAEANVLVVEVHVHELAKVALLVEQAVPEARIALVQGGDRRAQVGAADLDCDLAVGQAPQGSRDSECRHVVKESPSRETISGSDLFPPGARGRSPTRAHLRF